MESYTIKLNELLWTWFRKKELKEFLTKLVFYNEFVRNLECLRFVGNAF